MGQLVVSEAGLLLAQLSQPGCPGVWCGTGVSAVLVAGTGTVDACLPGCKIHTHLWSKHALSTLAAAKVCASITAARLCERAQAGLLLLRSRGDDGVCPEPSKGSRSIFQKLYQDVRAKKQAIESIPRACPLLKLSL